jgi:hypothetical protein
LYDNQPLARAAAQSFSVELHSPIAYPAFYAYAYPEPPGCADARLGPAGAFFHPEMREWVLPYDAVRQSAERDAMVMQFLDDTCDAGASLAGWDIEATRATDPRPPRTTRE